MNTMQAVATVCAAALLAACDSTPQADVLTGPQFAVGGGGSGPAASGHVERDLPTFGVTIEKYSFSAHQLGNGEVGGRFEVRDILADGSESISEKGDVICFTVEPDRRTARMGGVITNSSDGLEGVYAVWTVRDNGEGSNDPPDQATDLRWGFTNPAIVTTHCAVGFPPEVFGTFGNSLRANVQVKP
jgi:hypothetical protein